MNVGNLVTCDAWVHGGRTGIVIKVQHGNSCRGAWVLLDNGVKLIRVENLNICERGKNEQ